MEKVKGNVTVESINEIMVSIQKDFFFFKLLVTTYNRSPVK